MFKQSIQNQKRARKNKDTSQGMGLVLMALPMMLVMRYSLTCLWEDLIVALRIIAIVTEF